MLMLVVAALMTVGGGTALAQTIDAGRGELPLRVPFDYDTDMPTPLVVLLHGFGSSGAGQESYMNFGGSTIVDSARRAFTS